MEEPIFRGAYGWREICIIKLAGRACSGKEIYLFYFVFGGRFYGKFFALQFWGAYYFRNFMVSVIFDV